MSNRYKGAVISATPPTTTGGESGTASGAWTLEQQMQLKAAGLWPLQPTGPYVEEVFNTWLYTGTDAAQTVTNNVNLFGNGGLVWVKGRSNTANNVLNWNTSGGTNTAFAQSNSTWGGSNNILNFLSNGFTVSTDFGTDGVTSGRTYSTWTFREQAKFFDVVTYTGNGTSQTISHNLGSTPGCIITKRTNSTSNWLVYHRSIPTQRIYLNQDVAATGTIGVTSVGSTSYDVNSSSELNENGGTYVALIYAHDAGGFGLTGTDNVISCGSFTTGSGGKISAPVNLGYEAQWLLAKNVDSAENWVMYDIMRGMNNTGYAALNPNTSGAEYTGTSAIAPTATGFNTPNASGPFASFANYIYIAIRRGPMRVPTSGTSVFAPVTYTGDNTSTKQLTSGFPIDLIIGGDRSSPPSNVFDRLRGVSSASPVSYTASTADEQSSVYGILGMTYLQTGDGTVRYQNSTGVNYVDYFFRRAPSFFDEVCYSGTGGSGQTIPHNLGVAPELLIFKKRNSAGNWTALTQPVGGNSISLNLNDVGGSSYIQFVTTYGAASITTAAGYDTISETGSTYVAYFFATCAGVSKVGSYTGTGTTLQVDCGFTGGARFVMIKRTDSTGAWYVWDSARGIVAGNDPYLLMNSTAAEVTGTDYVDTYSAGFEITSTAPAAINASGGTYIFLAIA